MGRGLPRADRSAVLARAIVSPPPRGSTVRSAAPSSLQQRPALLCSGLGFPPTLGLLFNGVSQSFVLVFSFI